MKKQIVILSLVALVAGACSSPASSDKGVATLEGSDAATTTTAATDSNADAEQAMLDFAQCMRDNGLPDFPDPVVGSDGSLSFGFRGQGAADAGIDPGSDAFRTAIQACGDKLQGIAFGGDRGQFDATELQDQLLAVAACLREKGYDVDDPQLDFSGGGPAGGERGPVAGNDSSSSDSGSSDSSGSSSTTSPNRTLPQRFQIFGPNFDLTDPDNQAALQACAESVGIQGFGLGIGGGPGGNGGSPPDGGGTTGTTGSSNG
jgi:hypothetical protein